jgi:hypothetical protein
MKKTYINPLTTCILVDIQLHLLAGSVITTQLKTDEVNDESDFVQTSRGNSLWDDNEE